MKYLKDIWQVFAVEVRRVFGSKMVLLVFFVATVLYPLVFCAIYSNEYMHNLPVALVDECHSEASKRFGHKLNALPEVDVVYRPNTMAEAERLMRDHCVHAVFYIPRDYSERLAQLRTARIGVFCDMSSFYYYKNAVTGGSNLLIDEMHTIELERYGMAGTTGRQADELVQPVVYDDVRLYNPAGGFGSFFIPALLMLVVHQTLFFGIGIMAGEACEDRRSLKLIPPRLRGRSIHRVTAGRALCYILLYIPVTGFVLWLVPHWFHLPQLGTVHDLVMFLLPFLFAVTFFGMSFGNFFVHERMSGVLCCLWFSVLLFFLSGIVWPQNNMPAFWLALSYLFPSTPGIEGFVRISTMGATLAEVRREYLALWIQAGAYFITACLSLRYIKRYHKP